MNIEEIKSFVEKASAEYSEDVNIQKAFCDGFFAYRKMLFDFQAYRQKVRYCLDDNYRKKRLLQCARQRQRKNDM